MYHFEQVKLGKDTPEVMIKYRIDDTAGIELVMLLSEAHPLYLPTITQERGIKVNIGNWKKWILQLNSYIGNQVVNFLVFRNRSAI